MSKQQIILRHPSSNRHQPLLRPVQPPSSSYSTSGQSKRLAEVAGGTAAECVAICCCCPCGLLNLLLLAVYKIPAGLCRRAMRKNRRRRQNGGQALPPPCRRCGGGGGEEKDQNLQIHVENGVVSAWSNVSFDNKSNEVEELEKEMWERFYGAGFWRSPSQRENDQPSSLPTIS